MLNFTKGVKRQFIQQDGSLNKNKFRDTSSHSLTSFLLTKLSRSTTDINIQTTRNSLPSSGENELSQTTTATKRSLFVEREKPSKVFLYLLCSVEETITDPPFLIYLAKWFEASICITYYLGTLPLEVELRQLKMKQFLFQEKYPSVKIQFSLFIDYSSFRQFDEIIKGKHICALAYSAKNEALNNFIFNYPSIYLKSPVFVF